jgi:hypothetical protein
MAVDSNRDGVVDDVFSFQALERLAEPWSETLKNADLEYTNGTLRLEARNRSVAVALAVIPADLPELSKRSTSFRRVVIKGDGIQLMRNGVNPAEARSLASYDVNSLATWPEHYAEDLAMPGTNTCDNCSVRKCQGVVGGGCGSTGCNWDCGIFINDTCGTSCGPGYFACCSCASNGLFPLCRSVCVKCGPIPGDNPGN